MNIGIQFQAMAEQITVQDLNKLDLSFAELNLHTSECLKLVRPSTADIMQNQTSSFFEGETLLYDRPNLTLWFSFTGGNGSDHWFTYQCLVLIHHYFNPYLPPNGSQAHIITLPVNEPLYNWLSTPIWGFEATCRSTERQVPPGTEPDLVTMFALAHDVLGEYDYHFMKRVDPSNRAPELNITLLVNCPERTPELESKVHQFFTLATLHRQIQDKIALTTYAARFHSVADVEHLSDIQLVIE